MFSRATAVTCSGGLLATAGYRLAGQPPWHGPDAKQPATTQSAQSNRGSPSSSRLPACCLAPGQVCHLATLQHEQGLAIAIFPNLPLPFNIIDVTTNNADHPPLLPVVHRRRRRRQAVDPQLQAQGDQGHQDGQRRLQIARPRQRIHPRAVA